MRRVYDYIKGRERALIGFPAPQWEGRLTVELIDAQTQIVKQKLQFRNTITDAGLNALGNTYGGSAPGSLLAGLNYIAVGTSSTAPANGQTALVAELGRTNFDGGTPDAIASGPSFSYWSLSRTRVFLEGEVNGALTECGFFSAPTGGTMWMRQLFKDTPGGTPVVVNKTSSDQLRVTYELRLNPPTADVTGNIVISGVTYGYTIRAAEIDSNWNYGSGLSFGGIIVPTCLAYETSTLGSTSDKPTGVAVAASSASFAAYSGGAFSRDATIVFEPGVGNFATGIGSLTLFGTNGFPMYQVAFSPKLPKISNKRLQLVFRLAWARFP